MSKHTPEPWGDKTHYELPSRMRGVWADDYQRAMQCVNACAGIEDPAEWMKQNEIRLSQLAYEKGLARKERDDAEAENQRLQNALNRLEKNSDSEIARLREALEYALGELTEGGDISHLKRMIREALKGGPHETI